MGDQASHLFRRQQPEFDRDIDLVQDEEIGRLLP